MTKPVTFPGLAQFLAATTGRDMTTAAHAAVVIGAVMILLLTIDPAYVAARHWIEGVLWGCLAVFAFEWVVRLRHAARAGRPLGYIFSGRGLVDAASVIVVPVALLSDVTARTAWLLAAVWLIKVIPGIRGLRQLRRVLVLEAGPLFSVLVLFLMVWFLGSVVVYLLERAAQPEVFSNLPSAMWWAVVTLTTTGYGDVVPITPMGRIVAALVMISGLGGKPGRQNTGPQAEDAEARDHHHGCDDPPERGHRHDVAIAGRGQGHDRPPQGRRHAAECRGLDVALQEIFRDRAEQQHHQEQHQHAEERS